MNLASFTLKCRPQQEVSEFIDPLSVRIDQYWEVNITAEGHTVLVEILVCLFAEASSSIVTSDYSCCCSEEGGSAEGKQNPLLMSSPGEPETLRTQWTHTAV